MIMIRTIHNVQFKHVAVMMVAMDKIKKWTKWIIKDCKCVNINIQFSFCMDINAFKRRLNIWVI